MNKIGVLQGVLSENSSFPYATWKSELEQIDKLNIDFLDWVVDSEPLSTFHNFLFSNKFIDQIRESNLSKEIRSVYCSCFEEYSLLFCDSTEKLYKRISILEKITSTAKKNYIPQIIIPIFCNGENIEQKQIDNIVFILRMALKNLTLQNQRILIETDFNIKVLLEIFHKVDNNLLGLSVKTSDLLNLNFVELLAIKEYLTNITIDNNYKNFSLSFKNLEDIEYAGHYLINDKNFIDNHLRYLHKWLDKQKTHEDTDQ